MVWTNHVDVEHTDTEVWDAIMRINLRGTMPKVSMDGDLGDDFCGRARNGKSTSFGAIEYDAGACDVSALARKAEALLSALPHKLN